MIHRNCCRVVKLTKFIWIEKCQMALSHQMYEQAPLLICITRLLELQWTPLNGITMGQTITDPINRMILIANELQPTLGMTK
jgi:hypothetical protein